MLLSEIFGCCVLDRTCVGRAGEMSSSTPAVNFTFIFTPRELRTIASLAIVLSLRASVVPCHNIACMYIQSIYDIHILSEPSLYRSLLIRKTKSSEIGRSIDPWKDAVSQSRSLGTLW